MFKIKLFPILGLLLSLMSLPIAQTQAQHLINKKNEFSVSVEQVRGGRIIPDFFNGGGVGLSYNRQLIPYVLLHSELSFSQFFLMEELGDTNYQNNRIIADLGLRLVPISYKRFQFHFGLTTSINYQQKSDWMDPKKKGGVTVSYNEKILTEFFNYSMTHIGYKFELNPLFIFADQWSVGISATVRSYPLGRYDIPRSFELGIQGGYRF